MDSALTSDAAWVDDGGKETTGFISLPYPPSPTEMNFPFQTSRPTSPSLLPFRLGAQPDNKQSSRKARESKGSDIFPSSLLRRPSTQPKAKVHTKQPPIDNNSSSDVASTFGVIDRDPFASHYSAPTSFASYESSRPTSADGLPLAMSRKPRGSLLVAASDALGWRNFGRRKPPVRQPPPTQMILPDVIEISAPRRDEEVEERSRLREQAAQAIGLGPFMVQQDTQSQDESIEEDDEDENEQTNGFHGSRRIGELRNTESAPSIIGKSTHDSSLSVTIPSSPLVGRYRSGSMLAHSRTNSTTVTIIPSFPSTVAALNQYSQSTATLPKYYPPSSLRIFALSKSWKSRFLMLTSPNNVSLRNAGPSVSHLHLFKSSSAEEKEIERLEINEESVIFVSEEEVGGRSHVIKVGGVDVGALKKDLNYEENGRTMWFLQIYDQAEAQKWISAIKNAILGQRTVRAGLGPVGMTLGGIEPRGDMDVMLSIRAQGLITSPRSTSPATPRHASPPSTISQADKNYAPSISSHSARSQSTVPKSTNTGAVSTLKGLFTSTSRPRSSSRATSIDSDRRPAKTEPNEESSFTSVGGSLLNMLKTNPAEVPPPLSPVNNGTFGRRPSLPVAPEHRLDRKIIERQPLQWVTNDLPPANPSAKGRANRVSLGALSLQPPPRKRWTSSIAPSEPATYKHANDNESTTGSISTYGRAETEPPSSPVNARFSFDGASQEPRTRAPSLQSVSTYGSENAFSVERSSSSTKRSSSMKRWSRQLPHRLTPPAGPPPAVPSNHSSTRLHVHPYTSERPPSRTSEGSDASRRSVVSDLPSFSKRASASSALSASTTSTTQSNSSGHAIRAVHRTSIPPPPRPPPTFSLPTTPDEGRKSGDLDSAPIPSSSKPSFRNSMTNRGGFRLSMIAPKPPPLTLLPPRPDDPELKTHRRSSSGSNNYVTQLESISGSPVTPAVVVVSPFPPPRGPLPPTPITSSPSEPIPPVSRHSSLKQRLRILSAPSSHSSNTSTNLPPPSRPSTSSALPTQFISSPPITPIAEKIALNQNDPSFLQLHTPITPALPPPPRPLPPRPEPAFELTSLSPPPRRGSKQISIIETTDSPVSPPDDKPFAEGEQRMLSLSRPGSVVSLQVVNI